MSRITPWQAAFNAGELSPRLDGRNDLAWWRNGCRELSGFVALPHGPAVKRPGTRFVNPVKTASAGAVLLVPFEFSDVQAYMLEFGATYLRIFRDKAVVVSGGGSPVEVATPYAIADLPALQWAQSADVLYLFHPDYQTRKLTRTSHTTWTLTTADFQDGPYLDENTTTTTLGLSATSGSVTVTASAVAGINGGDGFQATDIGRLIRFHDGTDWHWLTITARTSTTVVTATVEGAAAGATTATTRWRLGVFSDTTGWPRCGSFHQNRLGVAGAADAPNRFDLSATADFEVFTPGANDDDAIAYTIGADEVTAIRWMVSQRVLLLGTLGPVFRVNAATLDGPVTPSDIAAKPEVGYASASARPVRADRSVIYETRSGRQLRQLIFSFGDDGWLAPDLTRRGDHLTRPGIRAAAFQQEPWSLLWVVRDDGVLLACTFVPDEEVIAWAQVPIAGTDAVVEGVAVIPATGGGDDEVWITVARTVDGATTRNMEVIEPFFGDDALTEDAWFVDAGLTRDGRSNPAATLTFAALSGDDVLVTASASVLGSVTVGDRLVMGGVATDGKLAGAGEATVTEAVSSASLRVRIDKTLSALTWAADTWQLRDHVSTVSGLDHLEGETVSILADGAAQPDQEVSAGAVTLSPSACVVTVGLPYTVTLRPQRVEGGNPEGTSQGRKQRQRETVARVYRSATFRSGRTGGPLDTVKLRTSADAMDEALALETGDLKLSHSGSWSRDSGMTLTQTAPLPLTVVALSRPMEVSP